MARNVLSNARRVELAFRKVAPQAKWWPQLKTIRARTAALMALALFTAFGTARHVCAADEPPATAADKPVVPAGFDSKGFLPLPVMSDAAHGWWQKVGGDKIEILRTSDGGKTWQNITPDGLLPAVEQQRKVSAGEEFLSGLVDLDPLDADKLWLAAPLLDEDKTLLAYTEDGGQHWRQSKIPVCNEGVSIQFLDEQRGFLLAISAAGMGGQRKDLYATEDGGKRWFVLGVPSASGYRVGGFSFRNPQEGWIGGYYRAADMVPLYRTTDGARTWTFQELPAPKEFAPYKDDYYGNVNAPVFTGSERRQGTLHVALHHHSGDKPFFDVNVEYHTDDGGQSWHLPAAGVKITQEQ